MSIKKSDEPLPSADWAERLVKYQQWDEEFRILIGDRRFNRPEPPILLRPSVTSPETYEGDKIREQFLARGKLCRGGGRVALITMLLLGAVVQAHAQETNGYFVGRDGTVTQFDQNGGYSDGPGGYTTWDQSGGFTVGPGGTGGSWSGDLQPVLPSEPQQFTMPDD